jgi:hypothetical protein
MRPSQQVVELLNSYQQPAWRNPPSFPSMNYLSELTRLPENKVAWIMKDISSDPGIEIALDPNLRILEVDFTEQDRAIQFLRQCLLDKYVLKMVGDLRQYNINNDNNPSGIGIDYETNKETDVYLQGEHDPEKRINNFWRIFIKRLAMGDLIANALHVAADYARYYKIANLTMMAADWANPSYVPVNGYLKVVDGIPDTKYIGFLNQFEKQVFPKVKFCVARLIQEFFKDYFPEEWASLEAASLKMLEDASIPEISDVALPASSSSLDKSLLLAGSALWLIHFMKIGRK